MEQEKNKETSADDLIKSIKDFCKRRDEKFKKRKKWAIPLLILIYLLLGFLAYDRYSCTWGNDGDYYEDNIYFYNGTIGRVCMSVQEYDETYKTGLIKKYCLDNIWKCNIPVIEEPNSDYPNYIKFNISGVKNGIK